MGGAKSYKIWPVLIYSNGYWEVYKRFQGDFLVEREEAIEKREVFWESFSVDKFVMGEENFHERSAGFSSII